MGPGTMKQQLAAWWQALPPRDRLALLAGAAVLGLLLLFMLAVRPAWQTLRTAPAQLARAEHDLQQMRQQAAEAAALRQAGPASTWSREQRLRQIESLLPPVFGATARLQVQGDSVTLNLENASADQIAQGMALLRRQLHLLPQASRLQRLPDTAGAAGAAGAADAWSGSITWSLADAPQP